MRFNIIKKIADSCAGGITVISAVDKIGQPSSSSALAV